MDLRRFNLDFTHEKMSHIGVELDDSIYMRCHESNVANNVHLSKYNALNIYEKYIFILFYICVKTK